MVPTRLVAGLATVLLLAAPVALAPAAHAAEAGSSAAYAGPGYGDRLRHTPTAAKPQTKLWWHDRAWWGLLYRRADDTVRIAELMPDHTWRPTSAVVARAPRSVGDALRDGSAVHVLSQTADGLVASSFSYDRAARRYSRRPGSTAVLASRGSYAATLVKDSLGRLWVTYLESGRVWVAHTAPSGHRWAAPFALRVPGARVGSGEVADLVAFDGKVGVLWSDQPAGAFRFAVHADAAADSRWTVEEALAGPGMSDDHISAHVAPHPEGSTVVAAVKTSRDLQGGGPHEPLVLVLRRHPAGTWSSHPVATVADDVTRPALTVDAADTVYVVGRRGDSIVYKSSPLSDLSFAPGPGTRLMSHRSASFTDPTTTQHVIDTRTGLVVLASDVSGHRYWHGEVSIRGPSAPGSSGAAVTVADAAAPSDLRGRAVDGAVRLVWAPSTGDGGWAPAGRSWTVRGYTVLRDGRPIAFTEGTSYVDQAPPGDRDHAYAVRAHGIGGTRSAATAPVELFVPAGSGALPGPLLVVAGVVALAALGAAIHAAHPRRPTGAHGVPPPRLRRPSVPRTSAAPGRHSRRR